MRKLVVAFTFAGVLAAQTQSLRDKAAFEKVCGACHSFTLISDLKSHSEWDETVGYMVAHGAKGTPAQLAGVRRHLARNFTKVNVNTATAQELAPVLDVSEATARRLVQHRAQHGHFKSLDELKKTPGLFAVKLEARRERIAFQ